MSWRPKNWDKIKTQLNERFNRLQFTPFEDSLIEAGADAMFDALKNDKTQWRLYDYWDIRCNSLP